MTVSLNLKKNDILDLTKMAPGLNKITLGAGWDVVKKGLFSFGGDYDLDLVALLIDRNEKLLNGGVIYFGNLQGEGIYLHGDNRTGAGDGDDEKISVELNRLPSACTKVVFAVTIYNGAAKKQSFAQVKNAYVRLMNEENGGQEICRYNLTEDGGKNTAIIFAELENCNGSWQFKTRGELLEATVTSLSNMYK
ncbi:MAG: TerD family protein [Clostridium sp.]